MFVAALPLAAVAAIGICVACVTTPNVVQRFLELPLLRWLGSISYGGYLVHYPIYFAFGFELTQMSTWQSFQVISVSLLAGVAVERFVERPLRHRHVARPSEAPVEREPVCVGALATQ
jgi:peptidoglycan/LPS O-acetylase OafA/YrhL